MKSEFDKFKEEPQALFEIVDDVANGGSLVSFCKSKGFRYSNVINWIYEDEGRQKSYEVALEARGEWVAQKILAELQALSFTDRKKLFNDDGSVKNITDLDDDIASAIAGIDIQEEITDKDSGEVVVPRTRKIKMVDKLKAIELLGKNLKMFTDKVEHSGKMSLEELVAGSMKPSEDLTPEVMAKASEAAKNYNPDQPIIDKDGKPIKDGDILKNDVVVKEEIPEEEKKEDGEEEGKHEEKPTEEVDDGI
ncbi:terminase small subunit [Candidatus Pacearchaeota archaeon]|nr:terminase small subunit [Candidatus Pacearchaeota archaeon]